MIFATDAERSIAFYKHLGFEVGNTFAADGATKPTWAWLRSGNAQLTVADDHAHLNLAEYASAPIRKTFAVRLSAPSPFHPTPEFSRLRKL
jgi:catechol 2,3-dioxygenase-like lactoylglutathione lyase family enzyme